MKPILVIGGGIAGLTTALEAAELGCEVVLVEKSPFLGGRVARFHQYFPKLCPPACGLEINYQRLKRNPNISVLTLAEVERLTEDREATVRLSPRFVTQACTLCGDCVKVCPAKALLEPTGFPAAYAINRPACPGGCDECAKACKYGAIDLNQREERRTFQVSACVVATGWAPYDASRIDNLGFGKCRNVVTNVMLEEMAAAGPIVRPSDGAAPQTVAFVQCAGSRDENHLPYCSTVCCTASLKQATYLRAQYPGAKLTIFYIDIRTPGRLEDFFTRVSPEVELIKGKVAKVEEDGATGDLLVTAEDVMQGKRSSRRFSMVVLAAGMVPQTAALPFAAGEFGFLENGAGCAHRPADVSDTVRDATAAALKAVGSARHA